MFLMKCCWAEVLNFNEVTVNCFFFNVIFKFFLCCWFCVLFENSLYMPRTWRDALCFLLEVTVVVDFTWEAVVICLCSASGLFCGLLKGMWFCFGCLVLHVSGLCLFSSSGASLMFYQLTVNYWKVMRPSVRLSVCLS